MPPQLGPYTLRRNLPLSAEVLQVAGVDSYVNREYVGPEAGQLVQLYVGYWGRENVGIGHGPDVCFPMAGWHTEGAIEQRALRFPGAGGVTVETMIAIHHFTRTEPEGVKQLAVGFVVVIDGQFRASSRGVFLHRPLRNSDTGFLAHVEVTTPVAHGSWEAADSRIVDFMETLLPHVRVCLFGPQTVRAQSNRHGSPGQAGADS